MPEPGRRFVAADYSQIELRILAHVSGEESLVEAFRRGEDIHRRTAAEVFGVALDEVTPEQRDIAKTTNFAVIYGVTAFGLSRGLDIAQKQAQEYLDRFFARHPKVNAVSRRAPWRRARARLRLDAARPPPLSPRAAERQPEPPRLRRAHGHQRADPGHRRRSRSRSRWCAWPARWPRAASGAGCCCRCTTSCSSRRREGELAALEALAVEVMESALELAVPLKVDIKSGDRLGRGVRRFLLVGLTGGIATGKSTVSPMFAHLGAKVVDADLLAREVVMPGQPALAEIVAEFGADVLQPDGHLDRKRLGAIVFSDPERRKRLEQITHPAIYVRQQRVLPSTRRRPSRASCSGTPPS